LYCSVLIATSTTLLDLVSSAASHTDLRASMATFTLMGRISPAIHRTLLSYGLSPFTAVSNIIMVSGLLCYRLYFGG
jgi:hypothetical protein